MNEHRYILEKGSKKHLCLECTKKRFVRYIDTDTGEYLPDQYGRCDRESKCSYRHSPYKDGYAKMIWEQEQGQYKNDWKPQQPKRKRNLTKPNIFFIPVEVLRQTLQGYEQNIFIQNLLSHIPFPFETKDLEKVISLYQLGTVLNGYRTGANTFPFIDKNNNVRAIQVKQFDQTNHTTSTDFLHSIIEKHHTTKNEPLPDWLEAYNKNDTKVSCLFGEHLLSKYPYNPIALVEAPKTAIYGTLYFGFPEQPKNLLWLAVYNLSSLNLNKCQALKGRDVYLFPDLSKDGKAFELWSSKVKQIQNQLQGTYFKVSALLERFAPDADKKEGYDIGDYLIKQDWCDFREQPQLQSEHENFTKPHIENLSKPIIRELSKLDIEDLAKLNIQKEKIEFLQSVKKENLENWNTEINELEIFFAGTTLSIQPIRLDQCSDITNVPKFINSHLASIKANNGNRTFLPYLDRLRRLKQMIKN